MGYSDIFKSAGYSHCNTIPNDERLNLSDGWLTHFKDRNKLRGMKRHREAAS